MESKEDVEEKIWFSPLQDLKWLQEAHIFQNQQELLLLLGPDQVSHPSLRWQIPIDNDGALSAILIPQVRNAEEIVDSGVVKASRRQ